MNICFRYNLVLQSCNICICMYYNKHISIYNYTHIVYSILKREQLKTFNDNNISINIYKHNRYNNIN